MTNIQVDIDETSRALLEIENERRGGRAKREIIQESIRFYLSDMGALLRDIDNDIAKSNALKARLQEHKKKETETEEPPEEDDIVKKWLEERRLKMQENGGGEPK